MLKPIYEKDYSEILRDFYGIYVSIINPVDTPIGLPENGLAEHDYHSSNVLTDTESNPKNDSSNIRRVSGINEIDLNAKSEMFFLLDLPIPTNMPKVSIYDCIDLLTTPELLSDENAWFNEQTNRKENALKELKIWSLPKVLMITLKRFSSQTPENWMASAIRSGESFLFGQNNSNKNFAFVDFPLNTLDLSKYVIGYEASSYVYDLYGVCNHYGNISGGHYTSIVKITENEWLHFNDTNISKISPKEVVSPNAYCLFYRKRG
jgi:hypothetical protein